MTCLVNRLQLLLKVQLICQGDLSRPIVDWEGTPKSFACQFFTLRSKSRAPSIKWYQF